MKLPKFLYNSLKTHKTSLGVNEAFPPEKQYPFDYYIIKKRFNKVVERLISIEGRECLTNEDLLITNLTKYITRCKKIEAPIKDSLQNICVRIVSEMLGVPDEMVMLNCELVGEIKPKHSFRIIPEDDEDGYVFDDLSDFDNSNKVVLKRRLINSLIQGASYHYFSKYWLNEIYELNNELPTLYEKIRAINDYLLFAKEERISDKKPMQGACVEVELGRKEEKTEINVQALIFPYLFTETLRGFFELFASHGLPEDNEKAAYILKHADFLLAEPWDLRFGVELWNILGGDIEDTKILPYFISNISELPIDEFNDILKEIFAQTKKGKQYVESFVNDAKHEAEMSSLMTTIDTKNNDNNIITDDFMNDEELDSSLIKEGLYDDFDISDADTIYYRVYQDEDDENRECYYVLIYDMDNNIIYEEDDLWLFELDDIVGEELSYKMMDKEGDYDESKDMYCLRDFNSHEFGDPNETAKKLFKNELTEYYSGLRGYIMQDGTCIDFYADDHNYICKIPQIDDKYEFIALGNIRCADNFFDLIQEPTRAQKMVLRKLIANSTDLSVDIYGTNSDMPLTSAIYNGTPNPSVVLNQIDRYFNEGIDLQGGYTEDMYECFTYDELDKMFITEEEIKHDENNFVIQNDGGTNYSVVNENNNNQEDLINLILNANINDIDFKEELIDSIGQYQMIVYINDIEIPQSLINYRIKPRQIENNILYQVHMFIDDKLQHRGIGTKLAYKTIQLYGNIYAGFGRILNKNAVFNIFKKLNNYQNVQVNYVTNKEKQKIGIVAKLI